MSIVTLAWRVAIDCCRVQRRAIFGISFFIVLGAGLQFFFVNFPIFPEFDLLIASIFWQAFMAGAVAAVVVPVHFFVIQTVLRLRGPGEAPPIRPIMLRAFGVGLAIWFLTYGLGVGIRLATFVVPVERRIDAFYFLSILAFFLTTLLALVRPALSMGLHNPVRQSVVFAARHALALFAMVGVMLIPPAALGLAVHNLTPLFIGRGTLGYLTDTVIMSLFTIFQTLAVEVATVLFLRRAITATSAQKGEGASIDRQFSAVQATG